MNAKDMVAADAENQPFLFRSSLTICLLLFLFPPENWNPPALARFLRIVHSPMKSAWTPSRTSWRKLASSLKKPTRNTMRCGIWTRSLDCVRVPWLLCVPCVEMRGWRILKSLNIFYTIERNIVHITCLIRPGHLMAGPVSYKTILF